MKRIIIEYSITLFIFILFIVAVIFHKPDKAINYKYNISVGTAYFNYGYETNDYKDSLGYIVFIKKDGTKSIYPKEKIFSINQKK